MKKFLAILLVVVLAIGCFAGCNSKSNKDDSNPTAVVDTNKDDGKDSGSVSGNETKAEMTFKDISEAVSKMNEGAEINLKISIAIKPPAEGTFDEELISGVGSELIKKNAEGFYEIPVVLNGVFTGDSAKMDVKLSDSKITDMIVVGEKIYINAKAMFEYILSLAKAAGEELEVEWPLEGEYVDIIAFLELMQETSMQEPDYDIMQEPDYDINYSEDVYSDVEWSELAVESFDEEEEIYYEPAAEASSIMDLFLVGGIDEETQKKLETLVEVLLTAYPDEFVTQVGNKMSSVIESNNVVTTDNDSISIKLDMSNLKGLSLGFIEMLREYGVDCIDYMIQGIKNSDKLSEEDKVMLTEGYDKEEVKNELEEALNSVDFDKTLDEIVVKLGNTHFYIDMSADDNSVKFSAELLVDASKIDESDAEMEQAKFNFELGCQVKEVSPIQVPSKIITESELNTLMLFLS